MRAKVCSFVLLIKHYCAKNPSTIKQSPLQPPFTKTMSSQSQMVLIPTSLVDGSSSSIKNTARKDNQLQGQDPFLFYSNPANLRRALHFESEDINDQEEDPTDEIQQPVERKTRISFEKDPLTLIMEDEDFRAQFETSDGGFIDDVMSLFLQEATVSSSAHR